MDTIRPILPAELVLAATVAGEGLRDNPMTVRALGGESARRGRAMAGMFLPLLRRMLSEGTVLGAFEGAELVGVCGAVAPGRCRLAPADRLRLLPAVLRGVPPARLPGFLGWVSSWGRIDPPTPHWHVGPVAVREGLRGRGIGGSLLRELALLADRAAESAYLETDRQENVRFYEKFGFSVQASREVLSLPNWFMVRPGGAAGTVPDLSEGLPPRPVRGRSRSR